MIKVRGAFEHNLKGVNVEIERGKITVVTGVSGSGKSSLAFDTILAEAQRRFFYTLSHYSRQFLDLSTRPQVKHISGLSPAIALAQNETLPSRKATVGTLTDLSELMGVMFARFGEKKCPKHFLPTESLSLDDIVAHLTATFSGKVISVCAPLAEKKKGNFATRLDKLAARGFTSAFIDGKIESLNFLPKLQREEKHTIKLIVDSLRISDKSLARLKRSIAIALEEGEGFGEAFLAKADGSLDLDSLTAFSALAGCKQCGFAWPKLDSRHFSANSLGACEECNGYGEFIETYVSGSFEYEVEQGRLDSEDMQCEQCFGTGVSPLYQAITLRGKSVHEIHSMPLENLRAFIDEFLSQGDLVTQNPALGRVAGQIQANLNPILDLGLKYLQLKRRINTLSGGELQRLKLASILRESLRGILYVLDEPSQGLHPSEVQNLCHALVKLRDLGNTILVVDHDETLMRNADWIIDLGPGGGAQGGHILAKFKPTQAKDFAKQSLTAKYLAREAGHGQARRSFADAQDDGGPSNVAISLFDATFHNLNIPRVDFMKGQLNVVSGVSGAGKSSLVLATLYENAKDFIENSGQKNFTFRYTSKIAGLEDFKQIVLIDRKPVAKSSVSMPATYLDVFGELRELYGTLPDSQVVGLDASSFSLARDGGRCEECKGRGEINLQMRFLADARLKCYVCNGKRYRPHVLDIRYNGLSISEVLELTIADAIVHFKTFRKIQAKLQPAVDLGLGYLKMGQPSSSLSGGEAQRLKIVPYLAKSYSEKSLIIIDEPTTGLHFADVERLMNSLSVLVQKGATVVVIEHNLDVMKSCDWLNEIGPGSADLGGKLVFSGKPSGHSFAQVL